MNSGKLTRNAIGAIAIFVMMTSGCAAMQSVLRGVGFKNPTIVCRDVKVHDVSLRGVTLKFLFDVTNPNTVGFNIASIDYKLKVNDVTAASGRESKEIRIPAQGTTEVQLPYTIKYSDIFRTALSFVKPTGLRYDLAIQFGLKTPIGVIPIDVHTDGKVSL